ncbi:MAG: hypothetical protein PHH37_14520 [Paludibacter sp.]|nr:hypothetical protein [Paludibacter sp.]
MKRLSVLKKLLAFSFAIFMISSCVSDLDLATVKDNLTFDQSLVLPIGEASLTISDILNQLDSSEYIGTTDNQIYFQISDSVEFDFRDITLINSTDQFERVIKPSPNGVTLIPTGFYIPPVEDSATMNLGFNSDMQSQRIDKVKINSANLNIQVDKAGIDIQPSDLKFTLTFLNNTLEFDDNTTEIVYYPTDFGVAKDIALNNFMLNTFSGASGIIVKIKIEFIHPLITPLTLDQSSSITVKMLFKDVDFKVAYGRFSPTIADAAQEQVVDLGEYDSIMPKGIFRLSDPQMKMTIKNNIGVNLGVNLDYVKAYRKNEADFDTIYAKFKDSNSTKILVNAPSSYGETAYTSYTLDKDSGEIDRLFDNVKLPNMLNYKYTVSNAGASDRMDFITPHATISVHFDAKIPLNLDSGSYVEFDDTIPDLSLDSLLKSAYLNKAILVLNVTNGLPVELNLKLHLLNKDNIEIVNENDPIKTEYTINAPALDENNKVDTTKLAVQTIQIEVLKNQLDDLRATKSIAYTVNVQSSEGKPINFEPANRFKVRAGIFIQADASVDDIDNLNNE